MPKSDPDLSDFEALNDERLPGVRCAVCEACKQLPPAKVAQLNEAMARQSNEPGKRRIKNTAIQSWFKNEGYVIADYTVSRHRQGRCLGTVRVTDQDLSGFIDDEFTQKLRVLLKRKKRVRIDTLADELDVSPKRVRAALEELREHGYRVPEVTEGLVELNKVAPTDDEPRKVPLTLLDGERVRFGVVSDTHLCSKHCAEPELGLAYDHFVREGIVDVFHAGDLVAGVGIFPGQHNEITHHTYEEQRAYATERYPRRDGVTTHIIGGNHDLEGDFGRVGADPVLAVANQRDDMDYLGPYSAWVELVNGGYVHLLHGKGGMSYAYSYRAQKIVEGYGQGRKPGALILGHYHVQGNFSPRSVNTMFPACFEWQSVQFGARLGLRPTVGFHIVECRLADDGTFVEWTPRWFAFTEGRSVGW